MYLDTFIDIFKVSEIKDYLPKACPSGDNLILDGEVMLFILPFNCYQSSVFNSGS